jgi:AcrR family transcriptional regulator
VPESRGVSPWAALRPRRAGPNVRASPKSALDGTAQMFHNLYMCAASDDRKTSAIIRDTAMELFADRGVAGVSVRDIAAAAGVSPSLVIHHFRSKEGLRAEVDRHVTGFVERMLAELSVYAAGTDQATFVQLFVGELEHQPALFAYVRRLLIDDGPAGDALFDRLYEVTLEGIDRLVAQGLVRPAHDERTRAAFLLSNDLGAMILRRQLDRVLGGDLLSKPVLERWTVEIMDVYVNGMFAGGEGREA